MATRVSSSTSLWPPRPAQRLPVRIVSSFRLPSLLVLSGGRSSRSGSRSGGIPSGGSPVRAEMALDKRHPPLPWYHPATLPRCTHPSRAAGARHRACAAPHSLAARRAMPAGQNVLPGSTDTACMASSRAWILSNSSLWFSSMDTQQKTMYAGAWWSGCRYSAAAIIGCRSKKWIRHSTQPPVA